MSKSEGNNLMKKSKMVNKIHTMLLTCFGSHTCKIATKKIIIMWFIHLINYILSAIMCLRQGNCNTIRKQIIILGSRRWCQSFKHYLICKVNLSNSTTKQYAQLPCEFIVTLQATKVVNLSVNLLHFRAFQGYCCKRHWASVWDH